MQKIYEIEESTSDGIKINSGVNIDKNLLVEKPIQDNHQTFQQHQATTNETTTNQATKQASSNQKPGQLSASNFTLSNDNCINYLVSLCYNKCNSALSIKDAELLNRAVRFLTKKPQMIEGLDINLDNKKSYDIVLNSINIAHSKGLLNLEEDALVYYCVEFLNEHLN